MTGMIEVYNASGNGAGALTAFDPVISERAKRIIQNGTAENIK